MGDEMKSRVVGTCRRIDQVEPDQKAEERVAGGVGPARRQLIGLGCPVEEDDHFARLPFLTGVRQTRLVLVEARDRTL